MTRIATIRLLVEWVAIDGPSCPVSTVTVPSINPATSENNKIGMSALVKVAAWASEKRMDEPKMAITGPTRASIARSATPRNILEAADGEIIIIEPVIVPLGTGQTATVDLGNGDVAVFEPFDVVGPDGELVTVEANVIRNAVILDIIEG